MKRSRHSLKPWKLTITAPGFPGSITTEDQTSEATWHTLFSEMLSDAYEAACRRKFPERQIASETRR